MKRIITKIFTNNSCSSLLMKTTLNLKFNNISILFLLISSFSFCQEIQYHNPYLDLQPGKNYYLFGHDVVFRTEPDKKSKVIDVLEIGTEIEIIEKTDKSIDYYGIISNYYKVKYKDSYGYILGSLISLEKKEKGKSTYFYTYGKEDDKYYLILRHLNSLKEINEVVVELKTHDFSLEVYNNKGIDGIEHIIYVNYLAEACGIEGGGIYLFQINDVLKKVFSISQISDAGVYWLHEELIFPKDEKGVKGKIVYEKVIGNYIDESTNWLETHKISRELEWKEDAILPKIELEN